MPADLIMGWGYTSERISNITVAINAYQLLIGNFIVITDDDDNTTYSMEYFASAVRLCGVFCMGLSKTTHLPIHQVWQVK
jgi:hypothetical protein